MRRFFVNKSVLYGFKCHAAFTLAEVLITLGIIGVVAALTMPTLIANHQKQVTVNRLKKSYSVLNQALVSSVADNGDFSDWGLGFIEGNYEDVNYPERLTEIVHNNFIPYLKVGKDCGFNKCPTAAPTKYKDGSKFLWHNDRTHYVIYLADGSRLLFFINNSGSGRWGELGIYIDINGDAKPNLVGRDVFYLFFTSGTTKVNMWAVNSSRNDLLEDCKYGELGRSCGALIQKDGWQIAKDYPW